MATCVAASKEMCARLSKDKCLVLFREARIVVTRKDLTRKKKKKEKKKETVELFFFFGYPWVGEEIQLDWRTWGLGFCQKCSQMKPPRRHLCSVCGRCILKMDHHCVWDVIIFGPKLVHVGFKLHLLSLGLMSIYSFGFYMIGFY